MKQKLLYHLIFLRCKQNYFFASGNKEPGKLHGTITIILAARLGTSAPIYKH